MSVHEPISTDDTMERPVERARRRLGVSWPTIILFAVVISFVNGFWVTSLQGTVGAIERSAPPFERWLRDSTVMVPLYAVGVLAAVLLARRWFGRSSRAAVRGAAAALLIIAACTLVGIAEVANSAAYDYRLQTERIELVHDLNHTGTPEAGTAESVTPAVTSTDDCVGECAAKESTLGLHIRAVTTASALMLVTNILLVGWLLAVGGDRLWQRPRAATTGAVEA
jgi:hypothetical protein